MVPHGVNPADTLSFEGGGGGGGAGYKRGAAINYCLASVGVVRCGFNHC
jgi:hypothetical protein